MEVSLELTPNLTPGSRILEVDRDVQRLEIPPGLRGRYRLAQLDDYRRLPRRHFPWKPPVRFSLAARASSQAIPGTWGFGFWNDPFSMALLGGRGLMRFPALPDALWFFFASPPSYLSLRDDIPASGMMAALFRSMDWWAPSLLLGLPFLPLLLLPPVGRLFRRLGRAVIWQNAVELAFDLGDWHTYEVLWGHEEVIFTVDGKIALKTSHAPQGPLGLVIWVDNQYAATPPHGRFRYGTLANENPAWIEIRDIKIHSTM